MYWAELRFPPINLWTYRGDYVKRTIDWPIVINRLTQHGIQIKEISKETGITEQNLCRVRSEMIPPIKEWNQAMELLDLYLKITGEITPWVGDHHE
jgi:hypothetical protein